MIRNFEFRIYPSPRQELTLENWLSSLCWTYNHFLEERKNYKQTGEKFTAYSQNYKLPELKRINPDLERVPSRAFLEITSRLNHSMQNFFRRVKAKKGEPPGFPRFKSWKRFNSLTLVQSGWKLIPGEKRLQGRLKISKLGEMPIKDWKLFPQEVKTKQVTLKRKAGKWFAVFCCELPKPKPLPKTHRSTGIDLGLSSFVMTSNGETLGDIEPFKKAEKALRIVQSSLSKKRKSSARKDKARLALNRAWLKTSNVKKHQQYSVANSLIKNYDLIAVEDLKISSLLQKGSKKSKEDKENSEKINIKGIHRNIGLASWGTFLSILSYKAEEAGRKLVRVNPRGTSQECSKCGMTVPKSLKDRTHSCEYCGLTLDRDWNSARNILKRALQAPRGAGKVPLPEPRRRGPKEKVL